MSFIFFDSSEKKKKAKKQLNDLNTILQGNDSKLESDRTGYERRVPGLQHCLESKAGVLHVLVLSLNQHKWIKRWLFSSPLQNISML